MLTLGEINQEMSHLKDWSLEGSGITKSCSFANFKEAMAFLDKVAEAAEKLNHNPDIMLNDNQLRLFVTTRAVNGLTKTDFQLAKEIDTIDLMKKEAK